MDIYGYVWVYIGIYGYEGVIYGWIWVYMGCIWFCLAINGNIRLKLVSMVMVWKAIQNQKKTKSTLPGDLPKKLRTEASVFLA